MRREERGVALGKDSHCTVFAAGRVSKGPNPWTLTNSQGISFFQCTTVDVQYLILFTDSNLEHNETSR